MPADAYGPARSAAGCTCVESQSQSELLVTSFVLTADGDATHANEAGKQADRNLHRRVPACPACPAFVSVYPCGISCLRPSARLESGVEQVHSSRCLSLRPLVTVTGSPPRLGCQQVRTATACEAVTYQSVSFLPICQCGGCASARSTRKYGTTGSHLCPLPPHISLRSIVMAAAVRTNNRPNG